MGTVGAELCDLCTLCSLLQWSPFGLLPTYARTAPGDPLSPYLFLFVADALSVLLRKEIQEQTISPIKITRNALGVSRLLFADDSLLFFKAEHMQAVQVKQVLERFCRGTGQLINPAKCSILFNNRCAEVTRDQIASTLGTNLIS